MPFPEPKLEPEYSDHRACVRDDCIVRRDCVRWLDGRELCKRDDTVSLPLHPAALGWGCPYFLPALRLTRTRTNTRTLN
jgi:hypothetical protein